MRREYLYLNDIIEAVDHIGAFVIGAFVAEGDF
jgi:hypothetical protein